MGRVIGAVGFSGVLIGIFQTVEVVLVGGEGVWKNSSTYLAPGVFLLLLAGVCFSGLLISRQYKVRMKHDLLATRCQRCPKCFYDLSARPREIDTCPECGLIAPRRECVLLWCKLLRSRF